MLKQWSEWTLATRTNMDRPQNNAEPQNEL